MNHTSRGFYTNNEEPILIIHADTVVNNNNMEIIAHTNDEESTLKTILWRNSMYP